MSVTDPTAEQLAVDRLCDVLEDVDAAVVHAFVAESETPNARRLRLHAELAEVQARWPEPANRPPLFGVPVGIKDVVHINTLGTRAGSRLPVEALSDAEGTAVRRLRDAGAVVAGKTVTTEFTMDFAGPTRNPHAPDHTPGGSSSGSAAAVAAGFVPLALGTQTVGSIIRPAAFCGVIGLKPTRGRIPVDGILVNSPSLDTLGFLAATPDIALTAARVLYDDWRPAAETPRPPVVGVPEGPFLDAAGTVARTAFEESVMALRDAGYELRRVPLHTDIARHRADMSTINAFEAAYAHRDLFTTYGRHYHPSSAAVIRTGRAAPRLRYEAAARAREAYRGWLDAMTDDAGVDVWITPAAIGPAPPGLHDTGDPAMNAPWSYAGWPVVTIPAGTAPGTTLPLGLQCSSRAGTDEALLSWAFAFARHLDTC